MLLDPWDPVQAAAGQPLRIVALGDSLTAGYGLARQESVPSLIQDRLKAEGYRYEVVNAGVLGNFDAIVTANGLSPAPRIDAFPADVPVKTPVSPSDTTGSSPQTAL